jgi:hypothetical protein
MLSGNYNSDSDRQTVMPLSVRNPPGSIGRSLASWPDRGPLHV